jgi:hypothetical protein
MQYQGRISDGQMHGKGKLAYESNEYYDGDWVRGRHLRRYFNARELQTTAAIVHALRAAIIFYDRS